MFLKYLYHKKKPRTIHFFKQIRELLFAVRHSNFSKKNGTFWIYPQFPSRKSTIYQISRRLKFNLVTSTFKNTTNGINFHDSTFQESVQFPNGINIINKNIYDISKQRVDLIHLDVFSYNTFVDPTKYTGRCVVKSNENAVHDGVEIQCPIVTKDESKVYQIVIDNQEGSLFVDYRVCVMKSDIVIIYKKYKIPELRFTNDTCQASIQDLSAIPDSVKNMILLFCKKIQCDFCELDVLKDNQTGKWYIIDLNKTPYGPPTSLSKKDKKKAVEILSNGFAINFLT